MSQVKVAPLGLRLFLEGIEVPVISAQVQVQPNQPATAAIQVIPSDMALHLLPRTLVHLFYLDPDELLPSNVSFQSRPDPNKQEQSAEQATFQALDSQYKLMFAGEVIGFNFGKNPSSRQLVLQCMDLSSYWDTCYQWFADYSVGGGGLTDKSANLLGAGKSLFNNVSGGHQWVIGRIINTKPKSPEYQKAEGLLAGIIHLLEAIGGIRYRNGGEAGFNGVNDFFTIAELRYNLLGMVGAVEADESSAKLFANKAFRSWLRNGMTSLGSMLSFRDIMNYVMKHIYHNVYPNPTPYFTAGGETTRTATVEGSIFTDDPAGGFARSLLTGTAGAATKAIAAYAQVISGNNAGGIFVTNFTRASRLVFQAQKFIERAETEAAGISTDDASDVQAKIGGAKSDIEFAVNKLIEIGFDPGIEEIAGGSNVFANAGDLQKTAEEINGALQSAVETIQFGIISQKERVRKRVQREVQSLEGAHLYSQLLFPETFFVSPPRCNVIFPDQYSQFSFSRNFMREVTRLNTKAGLGMLAGGRRGSALFTRNYFAPNIKDARDKLFFATMSKGARVLLPHEVHSGIIPKVEWVTDGHRWAVKASKEIGQQDEFAKAGKVGYIQRIANFQFYLHRWAARSMSVSCVFNPNLVMGLPALVMDRGMPSPEVIKKIESELNRRWMPVQYLGRIASLSHQVDQSGGRTQVAFQYCRTHRGLDDEFLGVLSKETERTKEARFDRSFRTLKTLDPGSSGRQNRNRTQWKKLIKLYVENNDQIPKGTRVFNKPIKVDKFATKGSVFVNVDQLSEFGIDNPSSFANQSYDDGSGVERTGRSLPEIFTITFVTKKGTGEYERSTRTVEEALTPGWFSDVWTNENISENVYTPLLGSLAITDFVSVSSEAQNEVIDRAAANNLIDQTTLVSNSSTEDQVEFDQAEVALSDVPGSNVNTLTVQPGSIEEAVDSLSVLYGLIRTRGGDVHGFIRDYTKRPIATMEDVLGSQTLVFGDDGNIDPDLGPEVVEGFHSRAFGDYNSEVQLPEREGAEVQAGDDALHVLFPGVAKGTEVTRPAALDRGEGSFALRPELDPRGRARARVRAYIEELNVSRGLLG